MGMFDRYLEVSLLLAVAGVNISEAQDNQDGSKFFCPLPETQTTITPCNHQASNIEDRFCTLPEQFCKRHAPAYRPLDNCQHCREICDGEHSDSNECESNCPWYVHKQCLENLYSQFHSESPSPPQTASTEQCQPANVPDEHQQETNAYKVLFYILLSINVLFVPMIFILRQKGLLKITFSCPGRRSHSEEVGVVDEENNMNNDIPAATSAGATLSSSRPNVGVNGLSVETSLSNVSYPRAAESYVASVPSNGAPVSVDKATNTESLTQRGLSGSVSTTSSNIPEDEGEKINQQAEKSLPAASHLPETRPKYAVPDTACGLGSEASESTPLVATEQPHLSRSLEGPNSGNRPVQADQQYAPSQHVFNQVNPTYTEFKPDVNGLS